MLGSKNQNGLNPNFCIPLNNNVDWAEKNVYYNFCVHFPFFCGRVSKEHFFGKQFYRSVGSEKKILSQKNLLT